MTESYYVGSSCRGSLHSCDFESSQASAASATTPVSARNALLSVSSIRAIISDPELFATATSVLPKLRAVVAHRQSVTTRGFRTTALSPVALRAATHCWVVKKKHHGAEISEFDRAKVSPPCDDSSGFFRCMGTRASDATRRSTIELRRSLVSSMETHDLDQTRTKAQTRAQPQWPLADTAVNYAVSAHVILSCRLDEAMDMLFSREVLQFDASMSAIFGAKKLRRGDLLVSREFKKDLRSVLATDDGGSSSYCGDVDLSDLSQHGWLTLQSVALRSRRSLNLAKHSSSHRQQLCFAAYSQRCPASNEAFYVMRTLPKRAHDQFVRRMDDRRTHQALRGDVDHIAAGYHLSGSYSDLSGHQTRIVMTAYVSTAPKVQNNANTNVPKTRTRFWGLANRRTTDAISCRRDAGAAGNTEAKYIVNLLAVATATFEQLVRRRRLGNQSFLHMPLDHEAHREGCCRVCRKSFGLLRVERLCQLCAQLVCRECSRKFDVEPVARTVRRNRICFACVASVDASVFQQDNPLLHTELPGSGATTIATTNASSGEENDYDQQHQDNTRLDDVKISTAFYDILLKDDSAVSAQGGGENEATDEAVSIHLVARSSSIAATTRTTSVSSTPGRQLADALFSSNPLSRARALEVVRRIVHQVTQPPNETYTQTRATSPTGLEMSDDNRSMIDKYLEARLHLSSIDVHATPHERSSSLVSLVEATQRRRRSTSAQCFSSSAFDVTTRPRQWTTSAAPEMGLDAGSKLDSAALDAICEVAAARMQCSMAAIVSFGAPNGQKIVGRCGSLCQVDGWAICPFALAADGKPFVVKPPARDSQLRYLRLVSELGVQFFAGFPIKMPNGIITACLCTMDRRERTSISLDDLAAMDALSKLTSDLFEEETRLYTARSRT